MGIIIRQSIKATAINYLGAFLGFLITFFVQTRCRSTEEIGLLGVLFEAAMLIASLAMLGVNSSAIRFFPYFKNPENKNNGFFFYLIVIPFIGALIFIPLYLILHTPIANYFSTNSKLFVSYYYWVIPLILFILYWITFEAYSSILMRIAIPRFIREIGIRICFLTIYLLYGFQIITIDGLVGGFILTYGLAAAGCLWYVSRIGPVSLKHDYGYVSKPLRKEVLNYTAFLLFGALSGSILGKLDLFMVSAKLGLNYAGIYRIAFYMTAIIAIPSQSISTISSPIAADLMSKEDFKGATTLFQKVALHQFLAGSLLFFFIWVNMDSIYAIIPNGGEYAAGKWVVFFMGLSKVIEVTLLFGAHLIGYSKFYYWRLYFTVFLTIITIILNNWLIPIYGISGAALAMLIS
ncbi:MAG: oligosaccharide flippase family protein, partial [Tannerellaceae bacterium]|nr:oligosaccharide flippase family protein [Tannerellaceae bacterium]